MAITNFQEALSVMQISAVGLMGIQTVPLANAPISSKDSAHYLKLPQYVVGGSGELPPDSDASDQQGTWRNDGWLSMGRLN